MKPIIMVEAEIGGEMVKVFLARGGWYHPGHPESRIPAILNRLTLHRSTPDEGDPVFSVARHAAKILGGTYKVYPRPEPKPGMIY